MMTENVSVRLEWETPTLDDLGDFRDVSAAVGFSFDLVTSQAS